MLNANIGCLETLHKAILRHLQWETYTLNTNSTPATLSLTLLFAIFFAEPILFRLHSVYIKSHGFHAFVSIAVAICLHENT